jgi:hypothetical protein
MGCLVVRVPSVDWVSATPQGLTPRVGLSPAVLRVGAHEWDVTEPFSWQKVLGAAPLGATLGLGFLLAGELLLIN